MERISSLKIALDNEAREEKYYLEQSERSNNPVVKRLLLHLATEERHHQDWIAERHKKMVETGRWPVEIKLPENMSTLKSEMKKLDYSASETADHDDNDIECLKKAVQFEMEAADFYFSLSKNAPTDQEATFFYSLGKLEQDHMVSIEDSLAFLEDPVGWYSFNADHSG